MMDDFVIDLNSFKYIKITDKWAIYEFSNLKTKKELTLYSKTKTPKGQEEV